MMLNEAIERWTACLPTQPVRTCHFDSIDGWLLAGILLAAVFIAHAGQRLIRTVTTLPALAWLPMFSRWLANWVKSRDYTEEEFLRADGAGEPSAKRRKEALDRLAIFLRRQNQRSIT